MMMARVTGYEPGELVQPFGDVHLYLDHLEPAGEQLAEQLARVRLRREPASPSGFRFDDVERLDHRCHRTIRAAASA